MTVRQSITALLLFLPVIFQGQTCLPPANPTNLSNIEIGSLSPAQDGLIHVTYAFDVNVDQNTQTLFGNAAQEWNGDLGTTGVIFEQAGPGQATDIFMSYDPPNSLNCIAIDAQTGNLGFNDSWKQLAASDPATATGTIGHELGHFLGMADAGPNPSIATIMNNTSNALCAGAQMNTKTVQFHDAEVGGSCTTQAQNIQNPPPSPGYPHPCLVDGNPCAPCDPECTPIILDTEGEGFHLTSALEGVKFDMSGSGSPIQIAWTDPRFSNAFLALPGTDGLVHNGKELFGNFTPQPPSDHPNGFLALAEFDKPENGGNDDGIIDEKDAVYSRLRLWIDDNHDGISQPAELHPLPEMGVYSLALDYSTSPKTDQFGNAFRYKAKVNFDDRRNFRDDRQHDEQNEVGRWAYDVFLITIRD